MVVGSGRGEVPFGLEGHFTGAYLVGQPQRWVEWCRAQLERGRDTHALTRACLVIALTNAGSAGKAMAAANGLIDAAEATRNPYALSFALLAYGTALHDTDADRALEALRRPGDPTRQRQPRQRDPTWRSFWPASRSNTATRWLHSSTSRWQSAITTTPATPP